MLEYTPKNLFISYVDEFVNICYLVIIRIFEIKYTQCKYLFIHTFIYNTVLY